ncbi:MAG: hypothetical protein GF311_15165 [Candidatus Lokiarchaeota archaeon]|nr:hypothetical protein [Candidatus Lokiarchaeota archaeon]
MSECYICGKEGDMTCPECMKVICKVHTTNVKKVAYTPGDDVVLKTCLNCAQKIKKKNKNVPIFWGTIIAIMAIIVAIIFITVISRMLTW